MEVNQKFVNIVTIGNIDTSVLLDTSRKLKRIKPTLISFIITKFFIGVVDSKHMKTKYFIRNLELLLIPSPTSLR